MATRKARAKAPAPVQVFSATDHAGLTADAFELYRVQGGRFVAVR